MPWFIGLAHGGGFARLEVTNRLSRRNTERFGPFRTRDEAQLYQEQLWGLHQIRRCVETLTPQPDHPGCIYGEMNQCLRPCQCAVTTEEYATEVARVSEFLATAGKSELQPLAATRDRAAAELDFEQAAMVHKRMEKVQATIAARHQVVRSVESFHGVAVTRAYQPGTVNLWPMYSGFWQQMISVELQHETRSLDSMLRECLQTALALPEIHGNRLEQLAIFSRWHYSSWCDGQWFPFETLQKLNYRRLVKSVSDLAKPPAPKHKHDSLIQMAEHEEIEEHIHHAKEPFDKIVAGSMAIIAAFLAIVSVLGQHFNTETLLRQQEASDQWAFYQAKSIKGYSAQVGQDVMTQMKAPAEAIEKYAKAGEKYKSEEEGIQEKAKDLEKERDGADAKSKRFHIGEVFLEIGIVLSSLAILTKQKIMFYGGAVMAVIGIVYAGTAFMM